MDTSRTDYRQLLESRTRDELNVIASKLKLSGYRKLSKDALVNAILTADEKTLSQCLSVTWWNRYHNHVYGAFTIAGVALTVLLYLLSHAPTPGLPQSTISHEEERKTSPPPSPDPQQASQRLLISGSTWKGAEPLPLRTSPQDKRGSWWFDKEFDDTGWKEIKLPILTGWGVAWGPKEDFLARVRFDFKPGAGKVLLSFESGFGIWIYINGQLVGHWGGISVKKNVSTITVNTG